MLVLVIAIAITISAYYLSSISIVDIQINEVKQNHDVLKQAKKALINYAITHADGMSSGDAGEFGYLPCPHRNINGTTEEGIQQIPSCGARGLNAIGYLPWKTLGTGDLRDSGGNCLWYAVSSSYKNAVYSGLINEDTNGMFQIVDKNAVVMAGNNPEDRIVAIIFAPGPALGAQARAFDNTTLCGDDGLNPQAYLEGNAATNNAILAGGVDQLDQFIHATLTSGVNEPLYNDRFITITRDDIWQAILSRSDLQEKLRNLTEALALCVREYSTKVNFVRLPWPAAMNLADYRDENNYSDVISYTGRFPYEVDDSNTAITVTGLSSDELFTQGNCNSLGAVPVDLMTANSEYRNLWNNWKDHFFYVVSEDFSPDNLDGSCGNCIDYKGDDMAAIVIYSGSRGATQLRTGPIVSGDVNTKNDISNYIENNVIAFNSGSGSSSYAPGVNDIMYCIKPDLTVIECPP